MAKPIPATISKVVTMADRSIRIQVDTQELDGEEMTAVFGLYGKFGYFLFDENEADVANVDTSDLPPVTYEKDVKTPSQRLRAVIAVLWQQTQNPNEISAEEFYRLEMEKIINHFKTKLN